MSEIHNQLTKFVQEEKEYTEFVNDRELQKENSQLERKSRT